MKVLVIGAACSGKTTLAAHIREVYGLNAVDMDDLILRHNGGSWPDIETKNAIVMPEVLDEALSTDDIVLFGNTNFEPTERLRNAGFRVMLIDVTPDELRRRDSRRLAEEGWTNIEWFDHNQAALQQLRANDLFDLIVDGDREVESIAADIVTFATRSSRRSVT